MLVRDFMTANPRTVAPGTSIADAMRVMRDHCIRRLPVLKEDALVGIVSDRDLRSACPSSLESLSRRERADVCASTTVQLIMCREVRTIAPTASIEEAARVMNVHRIGGLPVVQKDSLVGVITESDVFRCLSRLLGAEEGFLQVIVPNSPQSQQSLVKLLDCPILSTIVLLNSQSEVQLTFATRDAVQAQDMLQTVRVMDGMRILYWHISGDERLDPRHGTSVDAPPASGERIGRDSVASSGV